MQHSLVVKQTLPKQEHFPAEAQIERKGLTWAQHSRTSRATSPGGNQASACLQYALRYSSRQVSCLGGSHSCGCGGGGCVSSHCPAGESQGAQYSMRCTTKTLQVDFLLGGAPTPVAAVAVVAYPATVLQSRAKRAQCALVQSTSMSGSSALQQTLILLRLQWRLPVLPLPCSAQGSACLC